MILKILLRYITYRKFRTVLTILGIIISVAFLIISLSIGEGTRVAVDNFLQMLGHDKIFVTTYGEKLTDEDYMDVKKIKGIKDVARALILSDVVYYKGEKKILKIYGIDPENAKRVFGDVRGYRISAGRWLLSGEKYSATIGYSVAYEIFSKRIKVGDYIYIGKYRFKVVGIFAKTGVKPRDSVIYVNINTLREIKGLKNVISSIAIKIKEDVNPNKIEYAIKNKLAKRHTKENIVVMTPKKLREDINEFFSMMQTFLFSIVFLAIVVSSIGIMNTMHMNILDRKKDIGIMKALGCENKILVKLIIVETLIYSTVGYLIGLILGLTGSKILEKIIEKEIGVAMFKSGLSLEIVAISYAIVLCLSIISSIYPAYKISKIDPIKVIREI